MKSFCSAKVSDIFQPKKGSTFDLIFAIRRDISLTNDYVKLKIIFKQLGHVFYISDKISVQL